MTRGYKFSILFSVFLCSLWLGGCASEEIFDTRTPEGAFKAAEEYEKADRYEEAIQRYGLVKSQHPYSRFATLAELKMADLHYKREAYIEAQAAYQAFRELHPRHPQIDYVVFRLGMSGFHQLPPTIDRDLSNARKVIDVFDEVVKNYPGSQYAKEATEKRNQVEKMLAEKELYIADFYFRNKDYAPALGRYEGLLKQFPKSEFVKPALLGAALSAHKADERDKARRFVSILRQQFPGSPEAERAQNEIQP